MTQYSQELLAEINAFNAKQDNIYAGIRDRSAAILSGENGVTRNNKAIGAPGDSVNAHLVAYRFTPSAAARIENYSGVVDEALGGGTVRYGRDNSHMTITDHALSPASGHTIDTTHGHDEAVSQALVRGASKAHVTRNKDGLYAVRYGTDVVASGDAVLGLGRATTDALALRSNTLAAMREPLSEVEGKDIALPGAWGAHTTIDRMTADMDPDQLGRLREVMGVAPDLGELALQSVDVGVLRASDQGFVFEVAESFPLTSATSFAVHGTRRPQ
jgi:hypothetical protein